MEIKQKFGLQGHLAKWKSLSPRLYGLCHETTIAQTIEYYLNAPVLQFHKLIFAINSCLHSLLFEKKTIVVRVLNIFGKRVDETKLKP